MKKAMLLLSVVAMVLTVCSAFAVTNFCTNPGFEDGTDTAAPPWSFWGGTGGAGANPVADANNPSPRVWSNFGNPTYVNVAAQNGVQNMFLIPGAKYHVHAQYYVPSTEVLPGVIVRAGVYLTMDAPAPTERPLDPRWPDNPANAVSATIPVTDQWYTFDFDWTYTGTTIARVNYPSFRLYGGDGTTLSTASFPNPGGYFDNCQISSDAYTGVISGVVKSSSGPINGATLTITYGGRTLQTVTTGSDGAYSFADLIPGETYLITASKLPEYITKSVSGVASAVLPDIILDPNPDLDPDLMFAAYSSAYVGADWPLAYSDNGTAALTKIGAPGTMVVNGQSWEMNNRTTGDGWRYGAQQTAAIPVNGVSVVAAVRPIRNTIGDGWNSVVDIMYSRLVLCLRNQNGMLRVQRQGEWQDGPIIPNGQITVLSLVVQPTGEYKVYANGVQVMDVTTTADMTQLDPTNSTWGAAGTGFWSYINVGRNDPDGWTAFNGNIGDVRVYKTAIDDVKRASLESALTAKYGTAAMYTITATAGTGGTITPSGDIAVPQGANQSFTIATNYGYVLSSVKVDGVEQSPLPTSYTFSNVTANHTIDVNWTELPSISGTVSGPAGPIYSASVSLSTNSDGSSPVVTRFSDSTGAYKVTPPASTGTYYLVAKKGGYVTSAVKTVVMAGVSVTGQDFLLAKSATLDPLVYLDAASLAAGALTSWPNLGSLGGSFDSFDALSCPEVNNLWWGRNAVEFMQTADAAGRKTLASAIPTPAEITGNSDWTISADLIILNGGVNSENCYFEWAGRNYNNGQTAEFCYRDNTAYVHWGMDAGFAAVPAEAAWHNIAITYDGTTEKVYVDGILDRSDARALDLKAAGLMIVGGATYQDMRTEDQYWRFNGAISKIKIFDQALTAHEVGVEAGLPFANGIVKDTSGNPIYNAIVQMGGTSGPVQITAADGKFEFPLTSADPVEIYADALGYAANIQTLTPGAGGLPGLTITLTAKPEADASYIKNGGFETIDALTGKPAGWHDWAGSFMAGYVAGLGDDYISSTTVPGEFVTGTKGGKYTPASVNYTFLAQEFPVVEGSTYNVYWKMRADADTTGIFQYVTFRNAAGDVVSEMYNDWGAGAPASWTQFVPNVGTQRSRFDIPAGATVFNILLGCTDFFSIGKSMYFDDVVIDRIGPAIAAPPTPVAKISDLKALADGTEVQLDPKNVTAIAGGGVPAGVFYVEETDRSAGIRINWASAVAVNDAATVTGIFHKPATGEMYIDASAVTAAAGAATKPVFVTTSTLAGKLLDGMLIRAAGKVNTVGADYFTIVDGGVETKVLCGGAPGVTANTFVSLTGIGSYDGTSRAILRP